MRGSKTNHRQILALAVEPLTAGQEFKKWPKHVTLVSWFSGANQRKLTAALTELASRTKPINATLGEQDRFREGKLEVTHVLPYHPLYLLHCAGLTAITGANAEIENVDYISYKYRPHVTKPHTEPLAEPFNLDTLALVEDMSAVAPGLRQVQEVFTFDGFKK